MESKPATEVYHAEGTKENIDNSSIHSDVSSVFQKYAEIGEVTHNPLKDLSRNQVIRAASDYADKHGLSEDKDYFIKGALLAQSGETDTLTDEEKLVIEQEVTHKWRHPKTLYYLCVMCAMCAVVQGMDETVVNGAQLYFFKQFNISNDSQIANSAWIQGLVVGAPYLCCAVVGCWLTEPLNNLMGRRGVIFLSCLIAAIASIWEAFTYSWQQMFMARLLLGFGIGPKSTTVPVFAAECSPAPIRGALVMMWQTWTAFGIMFGYVMCLAFMPRNLISVDLGWRLMMGSTVAVPIFVCVQVFFVPESPRWYIKKGRHDRAYESLKRLRTHKIQAARDLFYMSTMIAINEEINKGRNVLVDIFTIGRNRRALIASQLTCFSQQFCGINVIAYYSSSIFVDAGFSELSALLASWGFGMVNTVFAIPAIFTIDTFGRRSLVLFTLPFLCLFLVITGAAFYIPGDTARVGVVSFGIYVYTAFYSPGLGPVPFTYSAECFPLHVRDLGMSMGTATLWGFNFVLSLTWPALLKRINASGGFFYYAGWNAMLFLLTFCFFPETKGLTLEELDMTFSVPTSRFIKYQFKSIPYNVRTFWLRQDLPKPMPLYEYEFDSIDHSTTSAEPISS